MLRFRFLYEIQLCDSVTAIVLRQCLLVRNGVFTTEIGINSPRATLSASLTFPRCALDDLTYSVENIRSLSSKCSLEQLFRLKL